MRRVTISGQIKSTASFLTERLDRPKGVVSAMFLFLCCAKLVAVRTQLLVSLCCYIPRVCLNGFFPCVAFDTQ